MKQDFSSFETKSDVLIWSVLFISVLGLVLYSVTAFLSSLTLSIFLYYSTRPLYRFLGQYKYLQNPNTRSLVTILVGVVPLVVLFGYTFTVFITEARTLILQYDINILNRYIPSEFISSDFITISQQPLLLFENANNIDPQLIQQIFDWGIVMVGFFSEALINMSLTMFILFYLLRDDDKIGLWFHKQLSIITPMWPQLWENIDSDLHTVFYGNILNMFFTAFVSILLFISYNFIVPDQISVNYPFLLGLLSGLASLLPVVGTKLTYVPLTTYLGFISYFNDPQLIVPVLLLLLFSFVFIDFIPDMIIRPYLSSQNIHPGLLLFGYISGATLIGWYGFFLAPIIIIVIYNITVLIFPRLILTVFKTRI